MSHSFFSPSKSHMWMHCFGAMAQPENQVPGGSSDFADDGTASHTLAAWALENGKDAADYPDLFIPVGSKVWDVDSERIDYVQTYIDEALRRAMGGTMLVEHRVDLGDYLGVGPCWKCECHAEFQPTCDVCKGTGEAPQGGTSDVVIILVDQETGISLDLKYGMGEKVYAAYFPTKDAKKRKINTQCGNYLLGVRKECLEKGYKLKRWIAIIDQPRLGHRDEFEITDEELDAFADEVVGAIALNNEALTLGVDDPKLSEYLHADEKTCRWCNAKVRCKELKRYLYETTKMEFNEETGAPEATTVPDTAAALSEAYIALPLIQQWLKAVNASLWATVPMGTIIGPDGQPLKMVLGKGGKRMWIKEEEKTIEGLMVGAVGENEAYEPATPITAPAFEKVLKKRLGLKGKKFEAHWEAHWKKYITNAKGSMQIALGSDPRPSAGKADASEFDDEISIEDDAT